MNTEVNKKGVILTGVILVSICYILYINGDEIETELAAQQDVFPMKVAKENQELSLDNSLPNVIEVEEDDAYPEIGLEVEYVEDYVEVEGTNIFYVYAISTVQNQPPPRISVLLLHGAAYEAGVWKSLGTLQFLAKSGYFPIAVDLPGFGKTKSKKYTGDEAEFLHKLILALPYTEKPVIVTPSMSGRFALPYAFDFTSEVRGLIPIAPVNTYEEKDYKELELPALIFYGTLDALGEETSILMSNIPNSKVVKIVNGGHPAYLDDLVLFHNEIKTFLDGIHDMHKRTRR